MENNFTVTVTSVFLPSLEIFVIWLNGLSVEEASLELKKQSAHKSLVFSENNAASFQQLIISQYRQFGIMEHFLQKPTSFGDQFIFPLPSLIKQKLIEMYYDFDENVVRELLGKKLNYRSRKELDEVCSKTNVHVGSCRRQFDNLKRISKRVEESHGSLISSIERKFLLPRNLASKYAYVIFLNTNRIETGKKKLSQYTFADFEYCAAVFMQYWTISSTVASEEFEHQLSQDIRDIRTIFNSNKDVLDDLRKIVYDDLLAKSNGEISSSVLLNSSGSNTFSFPFFSTAEQAAQTAMSKDFASIFKILLRNMLSIGANLTQPKEIRDIFIDLTEKIVEPCVSCGWRSSDAEAFFISVRDSWSKQTVISSAFAKRMVPCWFRLVSGIQLTSLRLFNDLSVALSAVK